MTQSTLTQVENPYDVIDHCFEEVLERIKELNFCPTLYTALKFAQPVERPQGRLPVKYMAREYLRNRLALVMQITINTLPELQQSVKGRVQNDLEESRAPHQDDVLSDPVGPMTELLCHVHINRDAIGIESAQDIEALFANAFDQAIQQIKIAQDKYEHKQQAKVKTIDAKSIFVIIGALMVSAFTLSYWLPLPGVTSSTKPVVNTHRLRRHVASISNATSKSHSVVSAHKRVVRKHH